MKNFLFIVLLTLSTSILSMEKLKHQKEIEEARELPDEQFCIRTDNQIIIFIDPSQPAHQNKLAQLLYDTYPRITRIRVVPQPKCKALQAEQVSNLYIKTKEIDDLLPSWANRPDFIPYVENCNSCSASHLGNLLGN